MAFGSALRVTPIFALLDPILPTQRAPYLTMLTMLIQRKIPHRYHNTGFTDRKKQTWQFAATSLATLISSICTKTAPANLKGLEAF